MAAVAVAGAALALGADTELAYGQAEPNATKIGALVALDYADWPDDLTLEAIQRAVAEYNATNPAGMIDLQVYNITDGQDNMTKVLEDAYDNGNGPSIYIGPSLSSNVAPIVDYANETGIILFSTGSEAESLAIPGDNLFRLTVSTDRQARIMADTMAERNPESVVTVVRNDTWGMSLNASLAQGLEARGVEIAGSVMFADRGMANWTTVVEDVSSAINNQSPLVAFIGVINDMDGLAAAVGQNSTLRSVEWFVTTSTVSSVGFPAVQNNVTAAFASMTNMTAIDNDVVNSTMRAEFEAAIPNTWFYEFAAYDAVFILGNAIKAAMASGMEANADNLKAEIPRAAEEYVGILGDVALNSNGDLLTPDRFGVWTVKNNNWTDTGVRKFTPVVDIGALLAIGDAEYPDDKTLEAARKAVDDYNNADGRSVFVNLELYNITGKSVSDVLADAYDGGNGPTIYIGPTLSSNLEQVKDYADSNGIVLFSPGSEAESLAVADDNIFRLTISTARQGHFMAGTMDDAMVNSAIIVVRNDPWGMSMNTSIAESLATRDVSVGSSMAFPSDGSADWANIVGRISTAIEAQGSGSVGVAFVGFESDQIALAAATAAASNTVLTGVPWFVTQSGISADPMIPDRAMRDFANATMMRGIALVVDDSDKRTDLDNAIAGLDYYDYAAYDTVHILGEAVASNIAAGRDNTAATLSTAIPAAAESYVGILGDVVLNSKGDLRTPDKFAVWQVMSGTWTNTGVTMSTPIVDIGALLAIGDAEYPDDKTLDAARKAVDDYNNADGRRAFVNLELYNITGKSVSDVLADAYDGGNGPTIYIGPTLSSNLEQVADYANNNGIVLFSPASEAESLAKPDDNIFRLTISTARQGHFMADTMADAMVTNAITVMRNDAWGRSINMSIAETLAARSVGVVSSVAFPGGDSTNWTAVVEEISTAIEAQGSAKAGVAFVGFESDHIALAMATAAANNSVLTGVTWFVTQSGILAGLENMAMRDFANATMMRGIMLSVEDSMMRTSLDNAIAGLDYYDYAAYDTVHILGGAISSNIAAGRDNTAATLRAAIPEAADDYVGILGDVVLNSKGDLRTPDKFAVWQVVDAMWTDTGATKSTPIVDIGALVVLESASFDDSPRLEAIRIAVSDYNVASESDGALYLNLVPVKVSLSPGAATGSSPSALDAITRAHNDNGIKYYVGPSTSGNSGRVLDFANRNNITLISPSSTAPSLSMAGDALFRLVPNDSLQGRVLADIIHNHQGAILASLINQSDAEQVITIVRDDAWGNGLDNSTSARLGVHNITVTKITHAEDDADWSDVAMRLNSTIASLRSQSSAGMNQSSAGMNQSSAVAIAVLHIGFPGDFAAIAAQSGAYSALGTVPWYGTDGIARNPSIVDNATVSQFADDVNLTATQFDIVNNTKLAEVAAALAERGIGSGSAYRYSAYDSVFVLGRSIEAALATKGDTYTPADVRMSVRMAASAYEGALGDIELNMAGDLRTPNSYSAWTVEGGAWTQVETHPSTPVFDVGALLMLDNNPIYVDDREKEAMDAAVDAFNAEHELIGDFYINLVVQKIRISPDYVGSPDPDALAGLMMAYDNGSGPSLYIGPSTSGNSERVLGYANTNDIVLLSHSSTAPSLAIEGDNLFRLVAPDNRQGVILGDLIAKDAGVTDLVMAVRGDTWGEGVDNSTAEQLGNDTKITRVPFAEANANWTDVAQKLGAAIENASSSASRTNGTAAVLFIGFDGDFHSIAVQSRTTPSLASVVWFGPDGVGNSESVIANATALAFAKNVSMTTVIFTVADNEINRMLAAQIPDAVYGPSAYDSVFVMGNAMKTAFDNGGIAPLDVKAAIPAAARAYTGALGNVALDSNGDLSSPSTYGIYTIGPDDTWVQNRILSVGDDTPPTPPTPPLQPVDVDCTAADIRCIMIGELYTASIAQHTADVHAAYALAVDDFNRREQSMNKSQTVQIVLNRTDMSLANPVAGLSTAYANGSGPSAYLGPITSMAAERLASFATENGIVLVSPTSQGSSPSLERADNLFRLSLSDRYEAGVVAVAASLRDVTTVVSVVRNDTYGRAYAAAFDMEADLRGMRVLDPIVIGAGVDDMAPTVAEINRRVGALNASSTDLSNTAIFLAVSHQDTHDLADAITSYPLLAMVKWFEPGNLFPPSAIADAETLGLAQAVPLYSTSWKIADSAALTSFKSRLMGSGISEPRQHLYSAYDAVFVLGDAIVMAMDANGSYTGNAVAAKVPQAADMLNGLLGKDLYLDANGDRVSPSISTVWKSTSSGSWESADTVWLDPTCGVTLGSQTLAFGDVRPGTPSSGARQTFANAGNLPIDAMSVMATPWLRSGAEVLPVDATEFMTIGGNWTKMSASTSIPSANDALSLPVEGLGFRINPQAGAGTDGPMSQAITYAFTCQTPDND